MSHDVLVSIEARLDELTDLFRRRLLEDRSKQRALDELYEQLKFARSGLTEQFMTPLVREVLLVCDRLDELSFRVPECGSILEELLEPFHRRGLARVDASDVFDPRIHESHGIVPTDSPADDGLVAREIRAGYTLDGKVVRPARVLVSKCQTPPTDATSRLGIDDTESVGDD